MSKDNNKEIEIKLSYQNKEEVLKKLGPEVKFAGSNDVHDIYYRFNGNEMKNVHDILRLRITDGESELTYKSKAEDSHNVWHRTELTTAIGSAEILDQIFGGLGIQKLSEHKSRKEYWLFDGCEIVFARFTAPADLEFMEIEGDSEDKIKSVVSRLGNSVTEVGEDFFKVFDDARNK